MSHVTISSACGHCRPTVRFTVSRTHPVRTRHPELGEHRLGILDLKFSMHARKHTPTTTTTHDTGSHGSGFSKLCNVYTAQARHPHPRAQSWTLSISTPPAATRS